MCLDIGLLHGVGRRYEEWNGEVSLTLNRLDDVSCAHRPGPSWRDRVCERTSVWGDPPTNRSDSAGPLAGWPCSRGWSSWPPVRRGWNALRRRHETLPGVPRTTDAFSEVERCPMEGRDVLQRGVLGALATLDIVAWRLTTASGTLPSRRSSAVW